MKGKEAVFFFCEKSLGRRFSHLKPILQSNGCFHIAHHTWFQAEHEKEARLPIFQGSGFDEVVKYQMTLLQLIYGSCFYSPENNSSQLFEFHDFAVKVEFS